MNKLNAMNIEKKDVARVTGIPEAMINYLSNNYED